MHFHIVAAFNPKFNQKWWLLWYLCRENEVCTSVVLRCVCMYVVPVLCTSMKYCVCVFEYVCSTVYVMIGL